MTNAFIVMPLLVAIIVFDVFDLKINLTAFSINNTPKKIMKYLFLKS